MWTFLPYKKFVKTLTSVKLWSSNCLNRKTHEQLLLFLINSQFRLHYAVQHGLEKPLGLLWLFRPSTAHITTRCTTTSITFKHVVEKLEQSWATVYTEYCQNRGQKKPAGKNPNREKNTAGNLGKTQAHALKSPSYEGYTAGRSLPLFTKHVFQQSTESYK